MKNTLSTLLVLGLLGSGSGLHAQSAGDWEFRVTPYAWLSGLSGEVGAIPGLPSGSVDLSFGDILDDLDFAGMLMASARNGPWVIYFDTTYVRTTSTEALGGIVFNSVKIRSETSTLALAIGRRLSETSQGSLDAYLGARAWWLQNRFDLTAVGGAVTRRTEKADWVNPLIGLTGRYRISDRWALFGALEVGGFGVGADSEWSVLAGATWQINDRSGLSFGWRHMEVDYEKSGVVFDAAQSGPVFGATFRF
ncbi:hypothetical protein KBY27_10465 [Ruegeria pomeroyi]|uniref:Outer membrane protein beta-barrel domain-containing protein n=1 Tax=Ruegeria pomeroyi TaxID=89184 RepID=A0A9Q3ZNP6_9RHOB|nr:hypothetical protein [Ruegeria pomeroyi]MCE8537884.1 hypothetical protein [Ruegeria pomeroyi]